MKLWLLEARHYELPDDNNPWKPWYDKTFEFIVRAEIEEQARQIATEHGGDELRSFPDAWTNKKYSACEELTIDGEPDVIMSYERQA